MSRLLEGLIIKGIAGFYYVKSGDGIYRCKARGIFKQQGIKLAVGDRVSFEIIEGNDDNWITELHSRKNRFIRPFITNVECFVVVVAAARPTPVLGIVDKLTVMAEKNETEVVICVNKADLAEGDSGRNHKAQRAISDIEGKYAGVYPVVILNSETMDGYDRLKELIKGRIVAFAGPSGVGKSTITNNLIPHAEAEIGQISAKTDRGKHTTRHSELFTVDDEGTMIFDTPGFTSFELQDIEEDELQHYYPEIMKKMGDCKYGDCRHLSEPGCAIARAVEEGYIHPLRYHSYVEQIKEIRNKRQY